MATMIEEYTQQRKLGLRARDAIHSARIKLEWERRNGAIVASDGGKVFDSYWTEGDDDAVIRLNIVNDYDGWEHVMDFDCEHKGCTPRNYCSVHKAEAKRVEREGAYGIVGEYRTLTGEWERVDSVWGFVGDDWRNSGYDIDIMAATMDAYTHNVSC